MTHPHTIGHRLRLVASVLLALLGLGTLQAEAPSGIDAAVIDAVIGVKGVLNPARDVLTVAIPRVDVKISVDGVAMPPFMGVTSWASFKADPKGGAMVMGDLVLFQDEVNPVMSVLFDHGLSVTAVHNHFFYATPAVYFMHIGGVAPAGVLAAGVRAAFDTVKTIRAAAPMPAAGFGHPALPATSSVSPGPLAAILGAKPLVKDGMAKFVFGRTATMTCGCIVGKEMGINTWAGFMGSDDLAVVDGDFATAPGELQVVLRSLRGAGIDIVAIHSHMAEETPRYIFLHYWGMGPAATLAKAVKAALVAQQKVTPQP